MLASAKFYACHTQVFTARWKRKLVLDWVVFFFPVQIIQKPPGEEQNTFFSRKFFDSSAITVS